MSIAVRRKSRSGQWCDGRRPAITSRRTGSATVSVAAAIAPIRRSFCRVVPGFVMALKKSSVMVSTPTPGSSSADVGAICRAYNSSRAEPLLICAATAEPADVPTSTSQSSSVRAVCGAWSAIPCKTPVSQEIPAIPPPARTSARLAAMFTASRVLRCLRRRTQVVAAQLVAGGWGAPYRG
ncbi:hypothetical protein I552_1500 [Mycobacterium xenopi 3993]|nr:hypothetical protein I552_1500 [Mycobacterium xenopi 3993]